MDKLIATLYFGFVITLLTGLFCLLPVVLIWTVNTLLPLLSVAYYIPHNFFTYLIVNMVFVYLIAEVEYKY